MPRGRLVPIIMIWNCLFVLEIRLSNMIYGNQVVGTHWVGYLLDPRGAPMNQRKKPIGA